MSIKPAIFWLLDITDGLDVEKDIITDLFKLLLKVSTYAAV